MAGVWCAAAAVLLAGCGVQPSGVTGGGEAPTGVAPGVTLYFVDAGGELRPQLRPTGRLGTVSDAVQLLLTGLGDSDLRTEIAPTTTPRVVVTSTPDVLRIEVPLTIDDVTPLGIDQIVCTALGVHVQGGGSRDTRAQVRFTLPTPESEKHRRCPVTG
ncbi:hypothetical protein [Streptomyces sp. NPDC048845]|uniref:hypothetical protein n=1 Tax=Streptomyces sp. NPDC048845 TaxID=3155390 RepID=UPI0034238B68